MPTDLNPQPKTWLRCSECKTSYVLRRAMVMDRAAKTLTVEWTWQRDCKHRKAETEVASAKTKRTRSKR